MQLPNAERGRVGIGAAGDGPAPGLVRSETSLTAETAALVAQLDFERRRYGRLRRVILTAGRLLVDTFHGRSRWWMVTLTYRPGEDWAPRQITVCMQRIRAYLSRRGLPSRYVWVLEATKAGRPHYHVLIQLPYGFSMPKPDKQGWWTHGLTRTEIARRAVGYLAKYASKAGSAITWKGARCYGVSGLSSRNRAVLSFWRAPRWVRTACGVCDARGPVSEREIELPVRRVREGWSWLQTGEILRSPTVAKFIGGVLCFLRRDSALMPMA
jgi:hypothetical protein